MRVARPRPFPRLAALAATLLAAVGTPHALPAQRPAMPRVRAEPCEGYCRRTWASCTRVALRAFPAEHAPVSATVDSGTLVTVIRGQRRITRPGIVVVRRDHAVDELLMTAGDDYVPPNPRRWTLRTGDTIYVVDKETDGDSYVNFAWVLKGREDTTASFWSDPEDMEIDPATVKAELVSPMSLTWWARVSTPSGKRGWTHRGPEWTGTSYYDDPLSRCVAGAKQR